MSYQDRIDIDRLYDLIYDARSEQLKVVTREEFEQLFGSISSFKDMQELYYDKSEVYLKILDTLKEAGVITDEQYNELVSRIESVSTVANRADSNATDAMGTAGQALSDASDAYDLADGADTKADDLRRDVGTVPSGTNLQSQITTVDGKADDLRTDVGTVTGGNLQSQINTVDGKADDLRDDVGTVTGDDLQTQVTTANGNASTALSTANTANGNASTALSTANSANSTASSAYNLADGADTKADNLRTDVGNIDVSVNNDLQSQILKIIELFDGLIPVYQTINDLSNYDYAGSKTSRGNYRVIEYNGYLPSEFVYELNSDKLYQRQYLDTTGMMGYYGEWVYITSPPSNTTLFPSTELYFLIVSYFASNNHTHTKSEVTDFSHTHTKSEITDFAHTHTLSEISDLTSSSETAFPYNNNATDYSTTNPVKITKWGRVITISGIGKLSTSVSANGDLVIGNMVSVLPPHDIYTTWTGINKQGFIKIATDGTVTLSNRNGTSTSMNSGEYFVFNCTYLI